MSLALMRTQIKLLAAIAGSLDVDKKKIDEIISEELDEQLLYECHIEAENFGIPIGSDEWIYFTRGS